MATTRNLNITTVSQAFAHYPKPENHEKEIFIHDGWTLDDIIANEYNDGMLIFAYRKSDQRLVLVAPKKVATKSQRESLMARVRAWLAVLPGTVYKTGYKDLSYTVLDGAGIIIQVPQKSIMFADGSNVTAELIKLIETWLKTAVYTMDDPDDPDDSDDPDDPDGGDGGDPDDPDDPDGGGGDGDGGDPDDPDDPDNPDDNDLVRVAINQFRDDFENGGGTPHSWKKGERL